MIRVWRKARWISLSVLIFIFIFSNCEKKPSPSLKKTKSVTKIKKEPQTYEELEQSRLSRVPKKRRHLREKAYKAMHEEEYEVALGYLREQYRSAKGLEEIGTMADMARCFRKIGEIDSALNLYEKCQVLAESLNDLVDLSSAYAEMGQTYCEKGEYEKAIPLYGKSMELAKKTKDNWNIIASYQDYANVYFAMGKYEESKNNLRQALELSEQKEMKEIEIHNQLGKLCYYEGDRLGMVLHQWKVPDFERSSIYIDGKDYSGYSDEMMREYKNEEIGKLFKMKERLLKCKNPKEVLKLILKEENEFFKVDAGVYAINEGLAKAGETLLFNFIDKNLLKNDKISLVNKSLYWLRKARPDYFKSFLSKFIQSEVDPAVILQVAYLLKEFEKDYQNAFLLYEKVIDKTKDAALVGFVVYDLLDLEKEAPNYQQDIRNVISQNIIANRFLNIYSKRRLLQDVELKTLKNSLPAFMSSESLYVYEYLSSIFIALFIGTGSGEAIMAGGEAIIHAFRNLAQYRKPDFKYDKFICEADIEGDGHKKIFMNLSAPKPVFGVFSPKQKKFIVDAISKISPLSSTLFWADDINLDGKDEILGFGMCAGFGHMFYVFSWNGKYFDNLKLWRGVPEDRDNDGLPEILYDEGSEFARPALLHWDKEEKKYIKDTIFTFLNKLEENHFSGRIPLSQLKKFKKEQNK